MWVQSILQILGAGLSIWDHKEKSKYVDRLTDLRRRFYEETNKPPSQRSDAVLDNVEFELRLLGAAFASGVAQSNAPVQQGTPTA